LESSHSDFYLLKGLRHDRNFDEKAETNVQFIDLDVMGEKGERKVFSSSLLYASSGITEKCDNKNRIYELRLVIYLCANL
jgi:hypothetical protein